MFKFATTRLFVNKTINITLLNQLSTLQFYNYKPIQTKLNTDINILSLWPFRLSRRDENLPKNIRKAAALVVRKLRKRSKFNSIFWFKVFKNNEFNTKKKFYTSTKKLTKWAKVPFSFQTTKSLTYFKGRKTMKHGIYMTFNNFTNLLFTIKKLIYCSKLQPKKYLISYYMFQKNKLKVMKVVDNLVFQTLKKERLHN